MSYDVQFLEIPLPDDLTPPIDPKKTKSLLAKAKPLKQPEELRQMLLSIEGCRPGPGNSIDYMSKNLSYCRMFIKQDAIHVENNCGPRDLLKIFDKLAERCPDLLIQDLQSRQLHNAESFKAWWSRPL